MNVTVIEKSTGKKLTMQELLIEVNRDRSDGWENYTENDDMVDILMWLDYDYYEVVDVPNFDYEQLAIDAGLLVIIDDDRMTTWTENPPENALRKFAELVLKNKSKINSPDEEFEKAFSSSFGYNATKDCDGEYLDVTMRDAKCLWDYKKLY